MYRTEIEINVGFIYDFTPAERRKFDSPGWPAEIEITGAEINGVRLTDEQFAVLWSAYDKAFKRRIEEEILEHEQELARDAAEYRDEARREAIEDSSLFSFGVGLAKLYGGAL